jgi:uncharacterized protein YbaR (Trm112 family)
MPIQQDPTIDWPGPKEFKKAKSSEIGNMPNVCPGCKGTTIAVEGWYRTAFRDVQVTKNRKRFDRSRGAVIATPEVTTISSSGVRKYRDVQVITCPKCRVQYLIEEAGPSSQSEQATALQEEFKPIGPIGFVAKPKEPKAKT